MEDVDVHSIPRSRGYGGNVGRSPPHADRPPTNNADTTTKRRKAVKFGSAMAVESTTTITHCADDGAR